MHISGERHFFAACAVNVYAVVSDNNAVREFSLQVIF